MALILLGAVGCEGAGVGQVTDKAYKESPGQAFLLEVQQPDGQRTRVSVSRQVWQRCAVGDQYPDCTRPKTAPALQEV